jgi:transposase
MRKPDVPCRPVALHVHGKPARLDFAITGIDEQIQRIEQRITEWRRCDEGCRLISEIPGGGLLTATATVAVIANAQAFRSGREFAACAIGRRILQ